MIKDTWLKLLELSDTGEPYRSIVRVATFLPAEKIEHGDYIVLATEEADGVEAFLVRINSRTRLLSNRDRSELDPKLVKRIIRMASEIYRVKK